METESNEQLQEENESNELEESDVINIELA